MKRTIKIKIIPLLLCAIFSLLPISGCTVLGRKSEPVKPHLIPLSEKEANPIRFIDTAGTADFRTDLEDSLIVQLADLLEIVSADKKKPNFTENQSPELKQVYDSAIKILDRYIKNSFSEFERVHAIHDYLTSQIRYDEDLYLRHVADPTSVASDDDSFQLTGVFVNKVAVCDGFSKAFSFLCGIEGIETEMIKGSFNHNGSSIPHVWNKVKIGSEWYNIDATQDNIVFKPDKGDTISVIHHGYFLLSDRTFVEFGGHTFSGDSVGGAANIDYDFHANEILFAGTDIKMQVNSAQELNAVFEYVKNSKRKYGQIELRLNLGLEDSSANLQDAYANEITAAYNLIKDKDFSFRPDKGMYPFNKYPRGVFVFLIYK